MLVWSAPGIFVVTDKGFKYVADVSQLSKIIDAAVRSTARLE